MRKKKPYDKSVYQSLVMITQFGINMIVPIVLMCALGVYLDRRQGTSFWTVLFFWIGAVAGGQNVYRMAKRIYASSPKEDDGDAKKNRAGDAKERIGGGKTGEKAKTIPGRETDGEGKNAVRSRETAEDAKEGIGGGKAPG